MAICTTQLMNACRHGWKRLLQLLRADLLYLSGGVDPQGNDHTLGLRLIHDISMTCLRAFRLNQEL